MNRYDRRILNIALPSIVSNITVPLLGLVDVAIVGHMGSAAYIGAVAVGSMIFNLVYWLFGFLRMGTSGMTAQAFGRKDADEAVGTLMRSVATALVIAAALIAGQVPLRWLMFWFIGPTPDVAPLAARYFSIVIWGAPASLSLFCLMGWYIGMQNSRIPMVVSILQNVVNIMASLLLVYGLGLKIEGVAFGTLIAQYAGILIAVALLKRVPALKHFSLHPSPFTFHQKKSLHPSPFTLHQKKSLHQNKTNRDLFLRTLCLVAVNLYFTSAGARQGAVILSVNTVMLQLYLFFSYFMDGFANAGEALGGRFYGAADQEAFRQTLRRLFRWMVAVTTVFTVAYVVGGLQIVRLLTDELQVQQAAADYIFWAWLIPAAGCVAFIWDGIFVGLTATRGMLLASVVATLLFFAVYGLAKSPALLGSANHALWLSQVLYLAMRGAVQTAWYQRKIKPAMAQTPVPAPPTAEA